MKVGVLTITMFSLLIGFPIVSFAGSSGDLDNDGVADSIDNCVLVPNAGPTANCDTDNDGYGNFCDGDLNNDQSTTSADVGLLWVPAFTSGIDTVGADLNCDGNVTSADVGLIWVPLFTTGTLGPSGLGCAGTVPCPTP